MKVVEAYIESNRKRFEGLLNDFLRIPSISTDPDRRADMANAAGWVKDRFTESGIEAEIVTTEGHPAVMADSGPVDGSKREILVYGHYDVQPIGERALWHSDPFEPTVRNGSVYARGSADDKGQVLTHVLAAEAWKKTVGKLPLRVRFLIEGEEEIGSPHLGDLVRSHKDRLKCDYVVISDTAKLDDNTPAVTYGTKGLIYKEILLTGPRQDLHSGAFGGTVRNPANVLAGIIAGLTDADGRVTIPGFYDDVQPISEAENAAIKALPFDENEYLKQTGSSALFGEKGFSTIQRRWARPTLDVNGLFGGYMGKGSSTIIPARAGAKVSMRIVPNQDPERISQAFDAAVRKLAPSGVGLEIHTHANAAAYMCPIDSPGMQAALEAIEAGFGVKPAMMREGGTLPILPLFRDVLGADSVMMGFAVPNCNLHGPNEFFGLNDFFGGIRSSAHFFRAMASR